MDAHSFLHGFRCLDTFFPSGGFAFSSGLETAAQEGAVRTSEDLSRYVTDYLRRGLGRCDAVALARAHHASSNHDFTAVRRADRALDAMKLCRETRAASRQMGRNLLRNAGPPWSAAPPSPAAGSASRPKPWDDVESADVLSSLCEAVESGRSPGHWAVVLGVTLQTAGWDRPCAVAGLLYQAGVGFVSASYKVLSIGQREGQRLLASWIPLIVELGRTVDADTPMTSWAPVQDVYAMRHARLTTRLFRS